MKYDVTRNNTRMMDSARRSFSAFKTFVESASSRDKKKSPEKKADQDSGKQCEDNVFQSKSLIAGAEYTVNEKSKKPLPSWLPFVIGALLVAQFAGLGAWQISRGLEKRATQQAFRDETGYSDWRGNGDVRSYQKLRVLGQFDTKRQLLLENIVVNGRIGYYVISAIQSDAGDALLLVNRGWIQKDATTIDAETLALPSGPVTVHGSAGSLPKAGIKMGDAIAPGQDWPKLAVYPSLDAVANAFEAEVQPFVLLLDHNADDGFYRHWVPTEFGPGKHFGYALQWFAMGAVLSGLLIWNFRRKRRSR